AATSKKRNLQFFISSSRNRTDRMPSTHPPRAAWRSAAGVARSSTTRPSRWGPERRGMPGVAYAGTALVPLTFGSESVMVKGSGKDARRMADYATRLGASKAASTLLVLFIPSKDRDSQPIDQGYWVNEALRVLGECFGGATAFPQGRGVWRDDAQG